MNNNQTHHVTKQRTEPTFTSGIDQAKTGVLVVGHGTAHSGGAKETRLVASEVSRILSSTPVALGFLEVIDPTIEDAMRQLLTQGCTRVVVAPILLFSAGHARCDLPEAVSNAVGGRNVQVVQAKALGCHPEIIRLASQRRNESLSGRPPVNPSQTIAVFLGRGSSAEDGIIQFREWVRASLDGEVVAHPHFEIGFAAAARPTLDEALKAATQRRPKRVIVQPHILFQGFVENQIHDAVFRCRATFPEIDWVLVSRLGADCKVARAIVLRANEAANAAFGSVNSFLPEKNLSQELI